MIAADYATGRADRNLKSGERCATSGQDGSGPADGRSGRLLPAVSGSVAGCRGTWTRGLETAVAA